MDKTLLWSAIAALLLATGCGKKETNTAAKSEQTPAVTQDKDKQPTAHKVETEKAKKIAQNAIKKIDGAEEALAKGKDLVGLMGASKKGPAISKEEYEKLMLSLADCKLTNWGIDRKCEAWTKFNARRKKGKTLFKNYSEIGQKHIRHKSDAIRWWSAGIMGGFLGSSGANQTAVIEAAKAEKQPIVLAKMISTVGSAIAKNPAVKDLIMTSSKHPHERVRTATVTWLTSSWAANAQGTLERAMEMAEKDTSVKVRKSACRNLGRRANEKAVALLEKLSVDPNSPTYGECLSGLVSAWCTIPAHEKPSEKAYNLTLTRLSAKPRTNKQPYWGAISGLRWAKEQKLAARAPWFKKDKLVTILIDLIKDKAAHWMARTSSVDIIRQLGASKAVFDELKTSYDGATGTDAHVLKKIEKNLASAP